MFITACCASCINSKCSGAVKSAERDKCEKYIKWAELPNSIQSKLFMAAAADEVIDLERLIYECEKY